MHIPKTAGMSLQGLVRRRHKLPGSLELVYDQEAIEKGFIDQPKLKTVMGHFRYGYHQFSKRSPRYFTFLRNPVDHVISHYYYSLEKPEKFLNLPKGINNIIDFAESAYGYNLQTRFVSGLDEIRGHENEALKQAIDNLDHQFEWVGITEEFDRSILMLGRFLGWSIMFYSRLNDGQINKNSPSISDHDRARLKELLQPDIKLYQHGLHLFNNQTNKHSNLDNKLKLYILGNQVFSTLNPFYIRLKKTLGFSVEDIHAEN